MNVIVLDETFAVGPSVQAILSTLGFRVEFAGSIHELSFLLRPGVRTPLLVTNLDGDLSGRELADQLHRSAFEGRTLVVGDRTDPASSPLLEHPRLEWVPRSSSPAYLEEVLRRVAAELVLEDRRRGLDGDRDIPSAYGIVGRSKGMQEVLTRIEKVAASDVNVCIYGESGTGKELIARAIHDASARRDRPFVTLDSTAIPEGLMESHLFGHVKGAFTGAVEQRDGVFSLAHTGTLFIDELCEMPLPLQAKLLRVIQSREFSKVGGNRTLSTDIRLITATNRDPKKEVSAGNFREDLYYRVAVVTIRVAPLRERVEDIPLLVEHFTRKYSTAYGKTIRAVDPAAMDRMLEYPWPGNVRQLENFVEQAVVLAEGETLTGQDLFAEAHPELLATGPDAVTFEAGLTLREIERRYILHTLENVRGNRTQAAKKLGISPRCLQYKLKEYFQESTMQEHDVTPPSLFGYPRRLRLASDRGR